MDAVLGCPGNFVDSRRYVGMMIDISWRKAIPILAGALLLAGCSEDKPTKAEQVAAASVSGAPPKGAADEAATNAAASNVSENNDLIAFSYASPADEAGSPELARMHDGERATTTEVLVELARREPHTGD